MTMPLPEIAQAVTLCEIAASLIEIFHVLEKRGDRSATTFARSENKLYHGCRGIDPQAKKITTLIKLIFDVITDGN